MKPENMLEEQTTVNLEDTEPQIVKHTIKDSVFTSLFREKEYLLQLYQALHPEDTEITEDAITDISLKTVLTNAIYNDLGFIAGNRLMVLVEAQSSWSMNIIIRSLMYLAQSYHEYFNQKKADIYSGKKVEFPKPELYVVFTGERVHKPEIVSLSEEFFDGEESAVEVKVKMVYGDDSWKEPVSDEVQEADIISQYITFTKIYNEQMKRYKRTRKAIMEAIRICKERNVLKKFLESREKEVVDIMMDLFDEERIIENYVFNREKEAAEKAEKRAEKKIMEITKKVEDSSRKTAEYLLRTGKLSVDEIAACLPALPIEDICQIKEQVG